RRRIRGDGNGGKIVRGQRQKILRAKWLDQITTRASQAAFYAVEYTVARRENHHCHLIKGGMAFEKMEQIETINAGEIDVEKNQIWRLLQFGSERAQRLITISEADTLNSNATHACFNNLPYHN